jgi:hypothetical protein
LQEPSEELAAKTPHLKEKLVKLESEMQHPAAMEKLMLASPDRQISLTDPDSRSMATSGRGSGVVGYNVQVAVDTEHHLIMTHEATNDGSDRLHNAPVWTPRRRPVYDGRLGRCRERRRNAALQSGDLRRRCSQESSGITHEAAMTEAVRKASACKARSGSDDASGR